MTLLESILTVLCLIVWAWFLYDMGRSAGIKEGVKRGYAKGQEDKVQLYLHSTTKPQMMIDAVKHHVESNLFTDAREN